jgi:ribosomal protein L11 methylase PrmA
MVVKKNLHKKVSSSFRDPSGFLFKRKGQLLRQINNIYKKDFDCLINSGLYENLVKEELMIAHKNVDIGLAATEEAYKIIKPEFVEFISYPYEWCFGQLKDAALHTLIIQKKALEHGMILKDASAYNVQFIGSKPLFIDTLSFEVYKEGSPWVAYRQFCQHFLAPLALMVYKDTSLNQILQLYIDGIPLDLASRLLPLKSLANISLFTHIHMHAKAERLFASRSIKSSAKKVGKNSLMGLGNNLKKTIRRLNLKFNESHWSNYYSQTNYSKVAFAHKKNIVEKWLVQLNPKTLLDLGANTGVFSLIASDQGINIISVDSDPLAIQVNYQEAKKRKADKTLSLVVDILNPSPSIGWKNDERESFLSRLNSNVDCVMMLALVHHLVISNNIPLAMCASFLSKLSKFLIIEFVPKDDSNAQKLLNVKKDIFTNYNKDTFEREFGKLFVIDKQIMIRGSKRTLYLMKTR